MFIFNRNTRIKSNKLESDLNSALLFFALQRVQNKQSPSLFVSAQ